METDKYEKFLQWHSAAAPQLGICANVTQGSRTRPRLCSNRCFASRTKTSVTRRLRRIIRPGESSIGLDDSILSGPPDGADPPKRFSHNEMITCESCLRANP